MPFINDVLEHNRETNAQQRHADAASQQRLNTSRFAFEPKVVMQHLRARIIGQEAALDEIENMLNVVKADFSSTERPLSVTLMLGSTGVGKTETVRLISEAIYGRPNAFCRIDMNTLAQEHYAAALTGAPPGYVGSKEGTTLFDIEAIQGSFSKPGIVLFDELEKASTEVIRSLLNILDSGTLTLSSGSKTIDFKNSLIFMTSNVGARQAQNALNYFSRLPKPVQMLCQQLGKSPRQITEKALHQQFDPEFLNRIDRILHYQPVAKQWLAALIDIELDKLNTRLRKQGRSIRLDASTRALLSRQHRVRFGARDLARKFRTQLEPVLARFILEHPEQQQLYMTVKNRQFAVMAHPVNS
ncbi:AAA family ATPase [Alkanindiges illinoisensis]|uniref:AAA family ATPase n=1 Tax=Alkanindiges illinoisensis TaxID=197183 RepID=UPI0004795DB4|nr:AAA family ATPase [Alkanindiges illinoisensis]